MVSRRIRGSIITISSADSHRTQKNLAPYCGAKAAVNHLTRSLAAELAPHGIRINTLAPGGMLTPMVQHFLQTPDGQAAVWAVPFKRFAGLEELDGPLILLASNASSYMTGSVLTAELAVSRATLCRIRLSKILENRPLRHFTASSISAFSERCPPPPKHRVAGLTLKWNCFP